MPACAAIALTLVGAWWRGVRQWMAARGREVHERARRLTVWWRWWSCGGREREAAGEGGVQQGRKRGRRL